MSPVKASRPLAGGLSARSKHLAAIKHKQDIQLEKMVADALGKPRDRLSFVRQTILPESNDRSEQPAKKISRASPLRKYITPAKEQPGQAQTLQTPNAKMTPAEMIAITPETAATEQTVFSSAVKSRIPDSMVCGEFESPQNLLKVK